MMGCFAISKDITQKKSRDPFFDNAKFILVLLVVFGHLSSMFRTQNEFLNVMLNFLAAFRMPALILIAGYFSKSFYKKGFINKVIKKTLFPYVLFEIIYSYYNYVLYDYDTFQLSLFMPTMGMWFLLSMFCWNLMLFIFTKIPYSLVFAFLFGIGIGYVDSAESYFSISRTFVFFPFFLIGYYMKPAYFHWVKQSYGKIVSITLFIFCLAIFLVLDPSTMRMYLLGKYSFDTIGHSALYGSFFRMMIYVVMLCGIISFLPWVPKKQMFFTPLGLRTSYVFILHFFFIKFIKTLDWYATGSVWHIIIIPLLTIIITFGLSSRPVLFLTRSAIECKFETMNVRKPYDSVNKAA
ncbi:acyltransferase family protein [Cytobacillus sp. IB215316]|uniref:acyltransferase family protein n=1 Tax=Cytobacillus sp. IB215316 TaxID=3097354 RepID=UPI002A17DA90|nr:acyltransferase family protein [Cytobacillus sp. IB215316]MDX8362578.1 acyltransferase family protein [Cytobacillus sp. IB215316]